MWRAAILPHTPHTRHTPQDFAADQQIADPSERCGHVPHPQPLHTHSIATAASGGHPDPSAHAC
jgi:hypothetical protein